MRTVHLLVTQRRTRWKYWLAWKFHRLCLSRTLPDLLARLSCPCFDFSCLFWITHWILCNPFYRWQLGEKDNNAYFLDILCNRNFNYFYCWLTKYDWDGTIFCGFWMQSSHHSLLFLYKWTMLRKKQTILWNRYSSIFSNRIMCYRILIFATNRLEILDVHISWTNCFGAHSYDLLGRIP